MGSASACLWKDDPILYEKLRNIARRQQIVHANRMVPDNVSMDARVGRGDSCHPSLGPGSSFHATRCTRMFVERPSTEHWIHTHTHNIQVVVSVLSGDVLRIHCPALAALRGQQNSYADEQFVAKGVLRRIRVRIQNMRAREAPRRSRSGPKI